MTKGPDAFRTISEVSEELNVPQHVLRFWETRFSQIRPLKRSGGRRFYRPDDVALLRGIRYLLYGAGYTIRGVQRILKEQGVAHVQRIIPASGDTTDILADALPDTLGGVALADGPATDDFGDGQDFAPEPDLGRDEVAGTQEDFAPAHGELPDAADAAAHGGDPAGRGADGFPHDGHARLEARHEPQSEAEPADREPAPDHLPASGYAGYGAAWEPAPEAGAAGDGALHAAATQIIDPVINRYAPGPLSTRAERTGAARPQDVDGDRVIQSQYRLTTDTREHLQGVLDEIRECRRLLNSALSRLQD